MPDFTPTEVEDARQRPRYIALTGGGVAILDADDYERLSKWKWQAHWDKTTQSYYARRTIWLRGGKGKTCCLLMHREVVGAPAGAIVDHINRNSLDNRKENLRICTAAGNAQNARVRRDNKSGYKGVSWVNRDRCWRANISISGKTIRLGSFRSAEAAHEAYKEASIRLHGEFSIYATATLIRRGKGE